MIHIRRTYAPTLMHEVRRNVEFVYSCVASFLFPENTFEEILPALLLFSS
jgi:hypothetical protein